MKDFVCISKALYEDIIIFLKWVAASQENSDITRSTAQAVLNSFQATAHPQHKVE